MFHIIAYGQRNCIKKQKPIVTDFTVHTLKAIDAS